MIKLRNIMGRLKKKLKAPCSDFDFQMGALLDSLMSFMAFYHTYWISSRPTCFIYLNKGRKVNRIIQPPWITYLLFARASEFERLRRNQILRKTEDL